jgi:chromosomal replication initiator protein
MAPIINEELVIQAVCKTFNIDFSKLKTKRRERKYVIARQVIMYLLRIHTKMTFAKIGSIFRQDHSTAMHAKSQIEDLLFSDKELKEKLIAITNQLGIK